MSIHKILGMTESEWEMATWKGRQTDDWAGLPITKDPRWHSHPDLGIAGHSHSSVEVARTPHTHRPVVAWDFTPIPVEADQ